MIIRFLVFIALLLGFKIVSAQFQDDFSDGDFTANPSWLGAVSHFEVNSSNQLHLISSGTDTSFLCTASNRVLSTEWQFYVKQSFNSSSNNHSRVYLVADQNNFEGPINGYFVQIGHTADNISLWRQDGNTLTELITGTLVSTANSVNELTIKVLCDANGQWELYADEQAGSNFVLEGSATDITYTNASFFGVFCKYTSSNSTKFYFDDFFVGTIQVDTIAPVLSSFTLASSFQLKLDFDEALDSASAVNLQNYLVNGGIGNPSSIGFSPFDPAKVTLNFANAFNYNEPYLLSINGIKDLAGNTATSIQHAFLWYNVTQGDVVINEIMADPAPQVGLPDIEYIELHNITNKAVSLKNWKLIIGGSVKLLPAREILPDSFILIGHESDEAVLSMFGPFIGLSSFSLTNSGASVELKTDSNRTMHYVEYSTEWYGDNNKVDGGWSLELIDASNYCTGFGNWKASTSSLGGTPNRPNAVKAINPDTKLPALAKVVVIDSLHIEVYFSETVDSTFATNPSNYSISDGIGNPLLIASYPPLYKRYNLRLSQALQPQIVYTLEINDGLADCAGNATNVTLQRLFGLPQLPDTNDLLINEVLFDPRNDGVDFVELYNNSNKIIDLKKLSLANWNTDDDNYDNVKVISEEGFQVFPHEYYVLSISSATIASQYFVPNPDNLVQMEAMPSLSNTSGDIYIITNTFRQIDAMQYTDEMHYALLNNPEGISLERLNLMVSGMESSNWHSAATPGRNATGFGGTPTYENSQKNTIGISNNEWERTPEIFSPDNDGFEDYLQLNYQLAQAGYTANILIYNAKGQKVLNLRNNIFLETQGQITWDGTDDDGNKANMGIYVIYIEMFNLNGDVEHFKLSCVLGGKL